MSIPRNKIIDALTARLRELEGDGFTTVTRRMFEPSPEQMPALVIAAVTEQTNEEDAAANPGKWVMRVGCFLWAKSERPEGPTVLVHELTDKIEDALKARPGESGGWWTTLGNTVWHAALVGVDTLGDEKSMNTALGLVRIEIACKPVR